MVELSGEQGHRSRAVPGGGGGGGHRTTVELCEERTGPVQVGLYRINRTLGRGNFAVVKLAVHKVTRTQVAIKIIDKRKLSEGDLQKVYREVDIMKRLHHPFIIKLYQVMETKDMLYMVLEYAKNGELFDYLSCCGRLSESEARQKFCQILQAVDFCHQNHIVHRDLKAENLLLDANNDLKLADFGFGNFYSGRGAMSTWCGSPPYAAPEVFEGRDYQGPPVDIWSLGVVLYVMVCGSLPFDGPSLPTLRQRVLDGRFRIPFFMSHDCENLIRRMLSLDPSRRITLAQIKDHGWLRSDRPASPRRTGPRGPVEAGAPQGTGPRGPVEAGAPQGMGPLGPVGAGTYSETVLAVMQTLGVDRQKTIESLDNRCYNQLCGIYWMLLERVDRLQPCCRGSEEEEEEEEEELCQRLLTTERHYAASDEEDEEEEEEEEEEGGTKSRRHTFAAAVTQREMRPLRTALTSSSSCCSSSSRSPDHTPPDHTPPPSPLPSMPASRAARRSPLAGPPSAAGPPRGPTRAPLQRIGTPATAGAPGGPPGAPPQVSGMEECRRASDTCSSLDMRVFQQQLRKDTRSKGLEGLDKIGTDGPGVDWSPEPGPQSSIRPLRPTTHVPIPVHRLLHRNIPHQRVSQPAPGHGVLFLSPPRLQSVMVTTRPSLLLMVPPPPPVSAPTPPPPPVHLRPDLLSSCPSVGRRYLIIRAPDLHSPPPPPPTPSDASTQTSDQPLDLSSRGGGASSSSSSSSPSVDSSVRVLDISHLHMEAEDLSQAGGYAAASVHVYPQSCSSVRPRRPHGGPGGPGRPHGPPGGPVRSHGPPGGPLHPRSTAVCQEDLYAASIYLGAPSIHPSPTAYP